MHIDPLTIVFALVAAITLWKLWSILGTRSGFERRPRDMVPRPSDANRPPGVPSGITRLPIGASPPQAAPDPARWDAYIEPGAAARDGLEAIAKADAAFAPGPFLDGAKAAYEAVLHAFANADRKALARLLAPDVYAGFDAALGERERTGARLVTTIVSLDSAKVESAALEDRIARVAVLFQSKQISATHAADGSVTDGHADQIHDIRDLWTFSRDVKSRDPNWKLAGTAAGH